MLSIKRNSVKISPPSAFDTVNEQVTACHETKKSLKSVSLALRTLRSYYVPFSNGAADVKFAATRSRKYTLKNTLK